jgi:hypothetical protein
VIGTAAPESPLDSFAAALSIPESVRIDRPGG